MSAINCAKCGKGVYPLEAVRAIEKSFHKQCFKCKHCEMVLNLKGFAAYEGDIYCKPHYMELFKTKGNYTAISNSSGANSSSYNSSAAFKGFGSVLSDVQKPTKKEELKKVTTVDKSAPVIPAEVTIKKNDRKSLLLEVENKHELKHTETVDKSAPVIEQVTIKKVDRAPLLESIKKGTDLEKPTAVADHSSPAVSKKSSGPNNCHKCGKNVYPLEQILACERSWHKGCFRCKHCDGQLSLKGFATIENEPYCKPHYLELFKTKGTYTAITNTQSNLSSSYNASLAFKGVK